MNDAGSFWVFLSASPLFWLALTLTSYLLANAISIRCKRHSLANPVLISVALLCAALVLTGTDYTVYFEGAQFIHVLLGPATVALAIPALKLRHEIRRSILPIGAALTAGSLTGVISAIGIARLLGAEHEIIASVAPKSVTAPIAIGIADKIGGIPEVATAVVLITGIVGAAIGGPLMRLLRIKDWRARGFAMGISAHGIGTASMMQVNATAGTFAGVAMGLNGILTAFVAPLVMTFF